MTREEFITKYGGKYWRERQSGRARYYLSLELAMPRRHISKSMRNTVKIYLDDCNILQVNTPASEEHHLTELRTDVATLPYIAPKQSKTGLWCTNGLPCTRCNPYCTM